MNHVIPRCLRSPPHKAFFTQLHAAGSALCMHKDGKLTTTGLHTRATAEIRALKGTDTTDKLYLVE